MLWIRRGSFCLLLVLSNANSEVSTDGSVGAATIVIGPNYDIASTLGQQSGNNLFHSFSNFNIQTGESATFSGAASIQNIIGRVTGSGVSLIDGDINSSIAGADLWLINPNGVIFGANANLNVGGSFHVSTGDTVIMDDAQQYDALQTADVSLLVSNPVGFGFLNATPASIVMSGTSLSVASGETLSVVGGGVSLVNTSLQAVDGRVNVAALSSAGEVTFSNPALITDTGIAVSSGATLAEVNLSGSVIDGSGDGGAALYIRGGNIVIDGTSQILNGNVNTSGGVIHLDGNNIIIDGGYVKTDATGSGTGADIVVNGNNLSISNPANDVVNNGLISLASSSADGGNIDVYVSNQTTLDSGVIRSYSTGSAVAGDIDIDSLNINMYDGKIYSNTFGGGGVSGELTINASNEIVMDGESTKIEIVTFSDSNAGAININIDASDITVMNGAQISTDSFSAGIGAGINITADNLSLESGGVVFARSFDDSGQGINITLQDTLSIDGELNGFASSVSTDTFNLGQGSNVTITATDVNISNGGNISASTKRDGNAGNLNLTLSGTLSIDGQGNTQTGLFSESGDADPFFQQTPPFTGVGGNINVTANAIRVADGLMSSSAINSGNAGNINLNANDEITLDNSRIVTSSALSAGGDININVINLLSLTDSDITAEAFGVSVGNDGGNVSIDPVNVILNSSDIIARANLGNGGNITIVTEALTQSPDSLIDATSQRGIDGEVLIEAANDNVSATQYDNISFLDLNSLLTKACDQNKIDKRSSFVVLSDGGLAVTPANYSVLSEQIVVKSPEAEDLVSNSLPMIYTASNAMTSCLPLLR